jgi:hypothetical protein
MSYTPGPWSIGNWKRVVDVNGDTISISGISMPCGHVPKEDVSYANARLIAQAPAMLDALKEALPLLRPCEDNKCDGTKCEVCQAFYRITAIIRAAEGGE